MECSAKENLHIRDIFRTFLRIGRLPTSKEEAVGAEASREGGLRVGGFKRQSSAYSKNRSIRSGGGNRGSEQGKTEVSFTIVKYSTNIP